MGRREGHWHGRGEHIRQERHAQVYWHGLERLHMQRRWHSLVGGVPLRVILVIPGLQDDAELVSMRDAVLVDIWHSVHHLVVREDVHAQNNVVAYR